MNESLAKILGCCPVEELPALKPKDVVPTTSSSKPNAIDRVPYAIVELPPATD